MIDKEEEETDKKEEKEQEPMHLGGVHVCVCRRHRQSGVTCEGVTDRGRTAIACKNSQFHALFP